MTQPHYCQTIEELYERLQRSFEGCNYVNRVIVKGGRESPEEGYPRFIFHSIDGFVTDQTTRQGKITFKTCEEWDTEIWWGTIDTFISHIRGFYAPAIEADLKATSYQDGTPASALEFVVKA